MLRSICAAVALTLITSFSAGAEEVRQSTANQIKAKAEIKYPHIVLYSVAWCTHCRKTKEYLAKNGIPFVNRDVEADAQALQDLNIKYSSNAVPVIVFGNGNDEIVMKGFTPELFQKKLQQAISK
ncbi:MAG: glutaredoxin family protein [Desulfuromonadaceae bacterium]